MVFMDDTERAAELAGKEELETGLHLNLSMDYGSAGIPEGARRAQASAAHFFRRGPWTQVIYNPFIARAVASAFHCQLEEYRRLFRRDPAHYNGHKHFHLSLNMILGGVLPIGSTVRGSFTFDKGEKGPLNRYYRRMVDAWLIKRHLTTDAFFSLSPTTDASRLARIVTYAQTHCVELMVHPWSSDQYAFLNGTQFQFLINSVQLGGFAALRPDAKVRS
jgi:predicted glycoside hydrolase/deacetylase ChbG (UPF0249 family)